MVNKTAKGNIISNIWKGFKTIAPNPLLRTAIYGALGYGGTKLLGKPIKNTTKSLLRPIARRMGLSAQDTELAMQEIDRNKAVDRYLPWVVASMAALAPNVLGYNTAYGVNQLWSDDPDYIGAKNPQNPFTKNSNLSFEYDGFIPDLNYGKIIDANKAQDLFSNDPYLNMPQHSYARQFGTAVVTNAAQTPGGNTTLGSIFDSAVQKFNSKLSVEGVTSIGVKTMVANGMSKLFTNALDAMVDLDDNTKNKIVDTGTWAGAITAILE